MYLCSHPFGTVIVLHSRYAGSDMTQFNTKSVNHIYPLAYILVSEIEMNPQKYESEPWKIGNPEKRWSIEYLR